MDNKYYKVGNDSVPIDVRTCGARAVNDESLPVEGVLNTVTKHPSVPPAPLEVTVVSCGTL
jgi:hypothetical protein